MVKFPFDNDTLWEIELDSFNASTWSIGGFDKESGKFKQTVYYANVIRGTSINRDIAESAAEDLDTLFKIDVSNGIKQFIEMGKKLKSKEGSTIVIHKINCYLTAYVNEMLTYVCGNAIVIEDFFSDLEDLENRAMTSPGIKFVLNLVNDFIKTFVEINKNEPTRLQVSLIQDDTDNLAAIYRVRVNFTKAGQTFYKSIFTTEGITPVADKLGVYVPVPASSKLHGIITENLGDVFENGNRLVRVYYDNVNATQGVCKLTVFKCMTDEYKIRII